jgi:hypothetical protein
MYVATAGSAKNNNNRTMPSKRSIRVAKRKEERAAAKDKAAKEALKERIVSLRFSFPDDCDSPRAFNERNAAEIVWPHEANKGDYCLLDGFPCRVTSLQIARSKYYRWRNLCGMGLLDNKGHFQEDCHGWGSSTYPCIVPRVTEQIIPEEEQGPNAQSAGTLVSWTDSSYDDENYLRPPDGNHVVVETIIRSRTHIKKLFWTIPITGTHQEEAFYQFLHQQRDIYRERADDVQRFYHFLFITKQWKDDVSCGVFHEQEHDGVLKIIFSYLCGSKKELGLAPWENYEGIAPVWIAHGRSS